jgi:DNA-binding SARP family transcriptional activator
MRVESGDLGAPAAALSLQVRMLGPMEVRRNGVLVPLPASRKVRALLAYLALTPRGAARSPLCELLWDAPSDPRGELRWCLSKIRRVVDEAGRARVRAAGELIQLDLDDCFVDAIEVAGATAQGVEGLAIEQALALSKLFTGDLMQGLEMDGSPGFGAWLAAQRRRFRSCQVALLEHLARCVRGDDAFEHLEKWLELAPFDRRAHESLLTALARSGRMREGEEHLAAAARQFEADGLDAGPLRQAWRAARTESARASGAIHLSGPSPDADAVQPGSRRDAAPRRASIAVMPFADAFAPVEVPGGIADALAHDVITRLAKLRSLFVIAQGTVFALKERRIGAEDAGRMLNVDYVVSGSVRRQGDRLAVTVELTATRTARVVWAEIFNHRLDDAFQVLEEIGNRIVASIAGEIETIERNRAMLKPPNSLDAWEAHHRGLWHMYRFTRADNEQARHFFQMALRRDPSFARAYAGLSFTHWQNAFQGWAEREPEIDAALAAAARGVEVDDRDPAVHWAQGRALWLRGRHAQSVIELEQAVDLSPNFAHAHYTLAFVQSQTGNPLVAISASDYSRHLSPFDPLLFGMLGVRAMALVRLGRFDEAAAAAVQAAARPNAHAHIFAIAAYSLALADALADARVHAAAIRRTMPGYTVADFLKAFRFDSEGEALFRRGAHRIGME